MTVIRVTSVSDGFKQLQASMEGVTNNLTKELGIVTWMAAKWTEKLIALRVYEELNVTQKAIKIAITKVRTSPLEASVILKKTVRISGREFKPKQNKSGVMIKISRKRGAKLIPSAFQGPRPGVMKTSWKGNAFVRKGKARLPIVKLRGPSPWGVFVKNNMLPITVEETREYLSLALAKRIRFNELKKAGGLNWQQADYISADATGEN